MLLQFGCATTKPPVGTAQAIADKEKSLVQANFLARNELRTALEATVWPVASKNLEMCAQHSQSYARTSIAVESDFKEQAAFAREYYQFDNAPVFATVMPGGPAAIAGLQAKDRLTMVGDLVLEPGTRSQSAESLRREFGRLARQGDAFRVVVNRLGLDLELNIQPQKACRHNLAVALTNSINAWTTGRSITFTKGMLDFGTKEDLQYVFAHELAHDLARHNIKAIPHRVAGIVLDIYFWTIGAGPIDDWIRPSGSVSRFQVPLEREADYIALYLLARAGVSYEAALDFWDREAQQTGVKPKFSWYKTHPRNAERAISLKLIHDEILAKQKNGEALIPNGWSMARSDGSKGDT